jgi:superfamily II DNA or RNA helicase
MIETLEIDDTPTGHFGLRQYQVECIEAVRTGWTEASRQLIVLAGGLGKTICCAHIAKQEIAQGGRVLFVAHTEELIEQAQDKFRRGAGVESDLEKADHYASPYATCVVASVQTLARLNRLTAFADDHFTLVIVDEAHRGLSPSHLRVKNYFHFGADSLADGWTAPEPGMPYTPKANVLGVTATPSRGDKRSLGEFYQRIAFEYGLLEAVREGYLVRPIVKNIPLKIDMRGIRTVRSANGSDLDATEVSHRMAPVIKEIAAKLAEAARTLKTVVFMPSIETARLMAEALASEGLAATFVSGACKDREEKIAAFRAAGRGSVLCNAQLVVEGFDVPDIDGVCVLRPTKVWSFAVQAWVRATRTLTGLIDRLETKEERLAAIAGSAKPCFYIIDFLWLADQHDLITPVDLVAQKPEIRERMEGAIDLVEAEAGAQRDLLKALAKAAKKHERKQARVIDPLAWAVSLGDSKLASYEPQTKWEEAPPTSGQLDFIRKQGMDTTGITSKGLASKIINILIARMKHRLATPSQLTFMAQLGIPEEEAAKMTVKEASAAIDATIKQKRISRSS